MNRVAREQARPCSKNILSSSMISLNSARVRKQIK